MDGVVGFLLVLAGALVLWPVASHVAAARRQRTMDARSKAWASVTGKMITSSAVETEDDDGNTFSTPQVWYEYEVGGVHYLGDRLRFGAVDLLNTSREAVQDYVEALYPAGGDVTVYYDPAEPENAVLERGSDAGRP